MACVLSELFGSEDQPASISVPVDNQQVDTIPLEPNDSAQAAEQDWVSIAFLAENPEACTGHKPIAIRLNGIPVKVDSWRDVLCLTLEKVHFARQLPLPLQTRRGHRYFISDSPFHPDGAEMKGFREINVQGRRVFVDLNRSARDMMRSLTVTLNAGGVDFSEVEVQVV